MSEHLNANPETVQRPGAISKTKLYENDYRRIISQLYTEIQRKDTQLKGLRVLTARLYEAEQSARSFKIRAENNEQALKHAEARVAQLNKKLGIGPQTAFNRGVVLPGVSKKQFDGVVRENLKLKEAMDHIVAQDLGGYDVILRYKELCDLVSTLQKDLGQSSQQFKELEAAVQATDNETLKDIPKLQEQLKDLQEKLEASNTYCQSLSTRNDELSLKLERIEKPESGEDSTDGGANDEEKEKLVEENLLLKEKCVDLNRERATLSDWLEESKTAFTESQNEVNNLKGQVDRQRELIAERERRLAGCAQDLSTRQSQLEELQKGMVNEKQKNEAFFAQVETYNKKQKDYEDQLNESRRQRNVDKEDLAEQKTMNSLMADSLKSYEDDFRRENQEKGQLQKIVDQTKQENERTKRENRSHMATVKHLEEEYERLSKMLTEERKKGGGGRMQTGRDFGLMTYHGGTFLGDNRRMVSVSDGGLGVDEKDGGPDSGGASMATGRNEGSASLAECPYCSRCYPYHLIEGHVQDCMEDSRFNDNRG